MSQIESEMLEHLAQKWLGHSLDVEEAAALAASFEVVSRSLGAISETELRDVEPPLRFEAAIPLR